MRRQKFINARPDPHIPALSRLPKRVALKMVEAFRKIAEDPRRSDLDIKPLTAREGFRLKIGGWRAIYEIERNNLVIYVVKIGPRGGVYK
jgi:mRNA interferase RelE/StbE